MSTSSTSPTSTGTGAEYPGEAPHADHEAHQSTHPSDATYIKVAIVLAALTAVEVGTYFIDDASTTLLVALLLPMMVVKFAVVALWFMHLRFDNPIFRRAFVFGLTLAVAVYVITLTSMQFWSPNYGS
ncbi:MAG TPA: cytochrome C oxidase subunit IV family protein [Acidimicrobiales bacterium]|nr:cytochrome C oxidase subunit IV family protein [Acidimicrobiales bacterium]